jgi:hypothetical protein
MKDDDLADVILLSLRETALSEPFTVITKRGFSHEQLCHQTQSRPRLTRPLFPCRPLACHRR